MKRIGKYLSVQEVCKSASGKTYVWTIHGNDGTILGDVEWYGPWRQYTFNPADSTTFNRDCLLDIARFLAGVNTGHKQMRLPIDSQQTSR